MWVYNAGQTSDFCAGTCVKFRAQGRPNNGPPPQCTLDDCLDCDETNAGPLFAKIAARSRRRSGLISKIARPCEDILFVDHQNPCDVVQGITPTTGEFEQGDVCQLKEPISEPECITVSTDLGLKSYETPSNGKFFDFGFNRDDGIYTTVYGKCKRYNVRRAQEGFWYDIAGDVLGPAYSAASTMSSVALIIGTVMWLFLWIACCVAFPRNFWFTCMGLFILCGILMFLTLVFTLSDVCTKAGCTLGHSAFIAILAGILWFITAGFCCKVALDDKANAYVPVSFDIDITEYIQPDGTILTEKVTTRSNGTCVVERTTLKRKQATDESSTHVETEVMASAATRDNTTSLVESKKDLEGGEGSVTSIPSDSAEHMEENKKKEK